MRTAEYADDLYQGGTLMSLAAGKFKNERFGSGKRSGRCDGGCYLKLDGPKLFVFDLRLVDKRCCFYDPPRMVVGDLRSMVLLLRAPEMIYS